MAKYAFPTSRVIRSEKGKRATLYRDKAVVIKKFIPGNTIRDIRGKGLFSLGLSLARLHKIPAPDYIPQTHSYGKSMFSQAYGLNADREFEDWLAKKKEYLTNNMPNGLPRGLIHADVFWDNILYLDGKFQALIDFEDACNYYKVYDLASAFFGTCLEDGVLNLKKAAQIVKGYQQIRKLKPNEKNALQLFSVYAGVAISFWRYMKYNSHNPVEDKKSIHKNSAEFADKIRAIPTEIFGQVFI
jgi:homoserine kinase type II